MGVTQYIGARYVPIFADPAEWTSTRTYEPLTIVMHEGNSFTSKQFVPIGIDINNNDFWAETGNYNAQVEAYRQEVLRFDERINEEYINYATPEEYGAKGDGVTDDTEALQNCIDENDVIVLNQIYRVTENIDITSPYAPNAKPKTIINNGVIKLENAHIHIHGEQIRFSGGMVSGTSQNSLMILGQTAEIQDVSAIKCTIENVYFKSENASAALSLINYYRGNFGCYCNTVKNIYAYNCTKALYLLGDVNANNITDVIMWSNRTDIEGMVVFDGIEYNNVTYAPKENNISQLFYYRGTNTPTVLYKASCKSGSYRNSFANCTSEQTGQESHFIEVEEGVTAGRNIYVGITTNLYSGDFDRYTKQRMIDNSDTYIGASNIFFGSSCKFTKSVNGIDATYENATVGKKYIGNFAKRQLENTNAALLISGKRNPQGVDPMLHGGFIRVTVTEFYSNVARLQHTESILIHVNNNGAMTIAEQIETNSRIVIDGNNIMYHTGNNGTAINAYITCDYEICSYDGDAKYAFEVAE